MLIAYCPLLIAYYAITRPMNGLEPFAPPLNHSTHPQTHHHHVNEPSFLGRACRWAATSGTRTSTTTGTAAQPTARPSTSRDCRSLSARRPYVHLSTIVHRPSVSFRSIRFVVIHSCTHACMHSYIRGDLHNLPYQSTVTRNESIIPNVKSIFYDLILP